MHAVLSHLASNAVTTWTGNAWLVMLAATAALHVAIYAAPYELVPYNALPWAFRFEFNLDLDFQAVTYATVHDKRVSRWSHLTLPLEQVAWVIVLLSVHPLALAAVIALLAVQALMLGERRLAAGVMLMWIAFAAIGWATLRAAGPAALTGSELLLLIGPLLRFIGHAFEPMPPFVADQGDAFVPLDRMRFRPGTAALVLGGIVSEFAAAMPHRLIIVQAFWIAQQLGYAPRTARPWSEARHLGSAVRAHGWKAYDKTEALFAPLLASVAAAKPAPSTAADG